MRDDRLGERAESLRLQRTRTVWLDEPIDDDAANVAMAKILFLQHLDREAEIRLVLDGSPGGSVAGALAIHDTLEYVSNPIATFGVGRIEGLSALLLSCGERGRRHVTAGAMLRLSLGVLLAGSEEGQLARIRRAMVDIFAARTGQDRSQIEAAADGEVSLDPDEARSFGLVDHVIEILPPYASPDQRHG